MRNLALTCAVAAALSAVTTRAATAASPYDGAWNLDFVTQRGSCDPNYYFGVKISNGNVSHPNLLKFRGKVTANGLVHASVTVGDKYASGSGTLSKVSGRGTWNGHTGSVRCSGYWTAQRT